MNMENLLDFLLAFILLIGIYVILIFLVKAMVIQATEHMIKLILPVLY